MGLDVHLHTYFAVETPVSSFFLDTGERRAVCRQNITHEITEGAKFCAQCGSEVATQAITEPAPAFKTFCDKHEVGPEEAFSLLRDGAWEWSDNNGAAYTIGWHRVQVVDGSEVNSDEKLVWALGIQIENSNATDTRKLRTVAYSIEDMEKLTEALREITEEFQIEGTPKLYVQVYFSY
jgi:hypothetical protein